MQEAYRLTRKDGAPGIDGVMADAYARNLDANLLDLLERIKTGRYQAPPVRRTYIPKADGSRRQPLRTRWRSERSSWCWRRCMSKTSYPAHSASGPVARLIRHCSICARAS